MFEGNMNGFGVSKICCDQTLNSKYEGLWQNGKEDGCGIFTWPSGIKTTRQYQNGLLISEQPFTPDAQASILVEQKMKEWNTKMQEEEKEIKKKRETMMTEVAEMRETIEKEFIEQKASLEAKAAEETKLLDEKSAKLEDDRKECEMEKQNMKFEKEQRAIVPLNIGGIPFITSLRTVTKLLSHCKAYSGDKDKDGAIWIDRDATNFKMILNFLRDGTLPSTLPDITKEELLAEANYYGLDDLVDKLGI